MKSSTSTGYFFDLTSSSVCSGQFSDDFWLLEVEFRTNFIEVYAIDIIESLKDANSQRPFMKFSKRDSDLKSLQICFFTNDSRTLTKLSHCMSVIVCFCSETCQGIFGVFSLQLSDTCSIILSPKVILSSHWLLKVTCGPSRVRIGQLLL